MDKNKKENFKNNNEGKMKKVNEQDEWIKKEIVENE